MSLAEWLFLPFLMSHFLTYAHTHAMRWAQLSSARTAYELSSSVDAIQLNHRPSTLCLNDFLLLSSRMQYIDELDFFFYSDKNVQHVFCWVVLCRHFDSTFLLLLFCFTPSSSLFIHFQSNVLRKRQKYNENILADDKNFVEKHCGQCAKGKQKKGQHLQQKQKAEELNELYLSI